MVTLLYLQRLQVWLQRQAQMLPQNLVWRQGSRRCSRQLQTQMLQRQVRKMLQRPVWMPGQRLGLRLLQMQAALAVLIQSQTLASESRKMCPGPGRAGLTPNAGADGVRIEQTEAQADSLNRAWGWHVVAKQLKQCWGFKYASGTENAMHERRAKLHWWIPRVQADMSAP